MLPIGISFFTFTQIAFLVDCYRGLVKETKFSHYLLFVSYFPHLISGAILRHKQMMPQFAMPSTYNFDVSAAMIGAALFAMGIAKKTLLADPLGDLSDELFSNVDAGHTPTLVASWFWRFILHLPIEQVFLSRAEILESDPPFSSVRF